MGVKNIIQGISGKDVQHPTKNEKDDHKKLCSKSFNLKVNCPSCRFLPFQGDAIGVCQSNDYGVIGRSG